MKKTFRYSKDFVDLHTLSFDMKDDDDTENMLPKAMQATKAGSEGNAEAKLLGERYIIDGKSAVLKQNIEDAAAAATAKKKAEDDAAAAAKAAAAAGGTQATRQSTTGVEAPQGENDGAEAKKAKKAAFASMLAAGHSNSLRKVTSSTFLSSEEERAHKVKFNLDRLYVPAEMQAPETPKSLKDLFNPSGNLKTSSI